MNAVACPQLDLFAGGWPQGLRYQPAFLSVAEESALLQQFSTLHFEQARYKSYDARRRIVAYGGSYDFENNRLRAADAVPVFLHELRSRIAGELGVAPDHLTHALISEYRPGSPLGWHRDVPDFELIAGISLGSACEMRFRPYPLERGGRTGISLQLAPRSMYVMAGEARWRWQHSIVATRALRYSVTFRTLRDGRQPRVPAA